MANEEHLNILKQGIEVWNRWREANPEIQPNLEGTNLFSANLIEANFSRTNFSDADLSEVNLSRANLSRTELFRTNLSRANLEEAGLYRANLIAANLSGVNLHKANILVAYFNNANLNEANFSEASARYTAFINVDLSEVRGLEYVKHSGPSTIGVDTLDRSKGHIPEVFLRGCGLSDWEIEAAKFYLPTLTSAEFTNIAYKIHELRITGIHYYSCFISYSSKDEAFAQHLHADLQQKGVRCWFAPEDMKIGDKIRPRIDESIRIHDKLLLILSENSLDSFWVESEVEKAFEEERKRNQTVLFPVRLDEIVMETDQSWAADIRRTRQIGDFSRWKDQDAYQKAFERLLRDLKLEE